MITLWHNPRCSKSRAVLALVEQSGMAVTLRKYLLDPPSEDELRQLLDVLGVDATQIIRKCERVFTDLALHDAPASQLIKAMSDHPILIERPILITPQGAAIGRPPEAVMPLLAQAASPVQAPDTEALA